MKLRHPLLIKAAALAGAWLIRAWMSTLRYRYRWLGPNLDPHQRNLPQRYIYTVWHENLLFPASLYARPDIFVLISQHADGQLIAEVCRHLGFSLIRGSTTRGGVEGVRRMLKAGRHGHLAITPDGPRGPRRRVQPGLVYLASRTGLPIVPAGIGFRRPWRMGSWDRFAIPRPFSDAACITTVPISIPPELDKDQLEQYRSQVEQALLWVSEAAERWAEE